MNPQSQPTEPASLPRPINSEGVSSPAAQPVSTTSSQIPQNQSGSTTNKSVHAPQIAEDIDLIEKEWVEKAKHIVAITKDNPSEQNVEISKLKSDYMKQRYNKDLEVDTDK